MAPRREPERTCLGCREKAPKRALLRMVRSSEGTVLVDPRGAAAGRGAYLHRTSSCVALAITRGALGRALRTSLRPDEAARLGADIERNIFA